MRKIVLIFFSLFFVVSFTTAQEQNVSGKVIDEKDQPVPFATVTVRDTKTGVSADADGNFTIRASLGNTLVVSGTGIVAQQVPVSSNNLSIKVNTSTGSLEEVVVTAFGLKRAKKAVTYSTQEVSGTQLNQANATSTFSALSGKVAGLDVTTSSGTPGAATFVRLRGVTSFGGGEPLIVVDGLPIDNSTTGMSVGNVAQSNRGIDISPDDIESISVLKGPAAAALYGTQGSDGAIIITTKKGKKSSKFEIAYSFSGTWDKVNKLPDLQDQYGQGSGGIYHGPGQGYHGSGSWGGALDTLKWTGVADQWDPHGEIVGASDPTGKIPVTPYDNAGEFFRTGFTQDHNLSVSGGNDFATYRLSYSNLYQTGIIPTSTFERNSISLNADFNFTGKLKAGTSIIYSIDGGSRAQEGSNLSGVMLGLLRTPNTFDNANGVSDPTKDPSAYEFPDGTERTYRGVGFADAQYAYYDNPYWTINKNKFNDDVNRIIGSTYLTYSPLSWLSITDRVGIDQYTDIRKQNFALNSQAEQTGQVIFTNLYNKVINNDLIATLTHKLADKLTGTLLLGANYHSELFKSTGITGNTLTVPDFYDLSNFSSVIAADGYSVLRTKAFFGDLRLSYNDYVFIDATLRTENTSAFVSGNHPKGQWYYFPSLGGSFVFTDALGISKSSFLSYGKVRVSYGQAGRLPSVYSTALPYTYNSNTYFGGSGTIADGFTNGITFPINSQQGFFPGVLSSPNINPERTSTVDVGTDLRFVNNRIGISFTYYNSTSKDLLVDQPISSATGYGNIYANAGKIGNHGIEITIDGTPVKTKNFTWDITLNWSMNRSKVLSLGPGIQTIFLGGFTDGAINAVKGQPYGVIYGIGYYKDSKGNTIINNNPDNGDVGFPIVNSNDVALGNPNPKWIAGLNNTFTYKNLSLSVLFDTKQKFDMWDGTYGALVNFGTAALTANRGQSYVFKGVSGTVDANGNVTTDGKSNNTSVVLDQGWYQGGGSGFSVNEPFVEDATYIKLKEVAISYYFDFSKHEALKFVKGITVGLVGRNLWLNTNYKGIDPESTLVGGNALGIDYFNNPGTRSLGLNAKINF